MNGLKCFSLGLLACLGCWVLQVLASVVLRPYVLGCGSGFDALGFGVVVVMR